MKVKKNHHMASSEFGLSTMYRILKKSGAERVSDESADELRRILEEIGVAIAKSAVEMSIHAGRKTVKAEDVRLAAKQFAKF
jgi:DNA-binding protein